jgi:GNAT superfamily N-acetyltransferase
MGQAGEFMVDVSVVDIRPSRSEDHERMAELARQLGYPSTAADVGKRLAGMEGRRDYAVFVAQLASGELAGWIGVFIYRCVEADWRAEISGLVVDEQARSQGIGPKLVKRVEEWARERGCAAIGVRSNVIRDRAHAFYERLGYEHYKTQKSFRKKI